MTQARIEIIGAGVAGLCCARLFAARNCQVVLRAASNGIDHGCCSWWAGGMLAPWCELESTELLVATLGLESTAFWKQYTSAVISRGSLVIAHRRDHPDLQQFASKTRHYRTIESEQLGELEPELADRFHAGLFFDSECHLDPRVALKALLEQLKSLPNVSLELSDAISAEELAQPTLHDWRVDCRGLAARDSLSDLRGVRGEMLLLHAQDVALSRPVRLLHPRYPIYVVPRADNVYMVGATMLESDDRGDVTVRSIMELLSAAYALHPGFAEATVLELGADARPAFTDNLPRLRRRGRTLYVNGLFRHGFLCGPAMAQRAVALALDNKTDDEVVDENHD